MGKTNGLGGGKGGDVGGKGVMRMEDGGKGGDDGGKG